MELSDPPETIAVREGEDFDHGRLAADLRGKLPDAERPPAVAQFAGGHANLTYLLRFGTTEYVLRRPPLGLVVAAVPFYYVFGLFKAAVVL